MKIDNKMLAALTKCEENANVDPPKSEILFASNFNVDATSSTSDDISSNQALGLKSQPIMMEDAVISGDNQLPTNVISLSGTTATAISCMPTFSGMPRFSIDIDQQLNNDHLTIVKKKLELQTLQRRLSYLADFYYRELLGTISWAKDLPGRIER